jgi:hypothetical protein
MPRPYQLDSYDGATYVMMKWTLRQIFERVAGGRALLCVSFSPIAWPGKRISASRMSPSSSARHRQSAERCYSAMSASSKPISTVMSTSMVSALLAG